MATSRAVILEAQKKKRACIGALCNL